MDKESCCEKCALEMGNPSTDMKSCLELDPRKARYSLTNQQDKNEAASFMQSSGSPQGTLEKGLDSLVTKGILA